MWNAAAVVCSKLIHNLLILMEAWIVHLGYRKNFKNNSLIWQDPWVMLHTLDLKRVSSTRPECFNVLRDALKLASTKLMQQTTLMKQCCHLAMMDHPRKYWANRCEASRPPLLLQQFLPLSSKRGKCRKETKWQTSREYNFKVYCTKLKYKQYATHWSNQKS